MVIPSISAAELTLNELGMYFTKYDMKRLEMYSNKLVDYHLIMDLVPHIARLYFTAKMRDIKLNVVQQVGVEVAGCDEYLSMTHKIRSSCFT